MALAHASAPARFGCSRSGMRFVRIVSSARRKTLPASSQNTCRWSASLAVGVMWANVIPERFQSRIRQSSRPVWVRAGADSEGLVARTGIETNVSILGTLRKSAAKTRQYWRKTHFEKVYGKTSPRRIPHLSVPDLSYFVILPDARLTDGGGLPLQTWIEVRRAMPCSEVHSRIQRKSHPVRGPDSMVGTRCLS
jgi:hypothetical protein